MPLRHPLLTVTLIALLGANGLLFAYGRGWLGGNPGSAQREPQRLAAQQHAERFQLLTPAEVAAARQPLQCREIGAFGDEATLQAAEAALRDKLELAEGSWQRLERTQPGVYLLATRAPRDRADQIRLRTAVERAGVSDFRPQSLMGERDSSWVLGRFDSEAAAQAEQRRLASPALPLRVVTQRVAVSQWWLRLPALTTAQTKAVHPAWPGGLRPCEAEPVPAALPAAASAP